MSFKLGPLTLHFSEASVFRTFITAPKIFSGSSDSIERRMTLSYKFDREVYRRGGQEERIDALVRIALGIINEFRQGKLSEDEEGFLERRVNTVSDQDNQIEAGRLFRASEASFCRLIGLQGTQDLAAFISKGLVEQGLTGWREVDVTDSAIYGNANYGRYIPHSGVIGIQVDKMLGARHPDLQLVDTCYHEQIHGYADREPKVKLPNPIEEEAANYGPKKWAELFLTRQTRFWGIRRHSDGQIEKMMATLWINDSDRNRHECVARELGGETDWGLKLLSGLKGFPQTAREKANEEPSIINKVIQQLWPSASLRIPFWCNDHNYGIG